MSDYRISPTGRILPGGMENEIYRLPMRLAGGALMLMAAVGWISLLTWSIGDPSLNRATGGAPSNLLGSTGASLADMLFQMLGLASITLFLPPAAWGIALVSGEMIANPRHRLAMWTLSLVFVASALSILPKPGGWLLAHGLGGVIGDFGGAVFLNLGGLLGPGLASAVGGALSGILGIWTLMRASGIGRETFRMAWQSTAHRGAGRGGLFKAGAASALSGARGLARRFAEALDRETASKQSARKAYWQPDDPDRFAPSRPEEGSFNPRFGRHGLEEDEIAVSRPRVRRPQPIRVAEAAQTVLDGRIEPYFDSLRIIPRQPPSRPAVPQAQYQPSPRATSQPQQLRPAPAPPPAYRQDLDEPPRHRANGRYDDAAQEEHYYEEAEPDQSYYDDDDIAFDAPPPPAPPLVLAPVHRGSSPAGLHPQAVQVRGRSAVERHSLTDDTEPGDFVMPPLKLLSPAPPRHNDPELSDAALGRRAEMLQGVLEDFRVKGQIGGVHPGPVITLYEFEPARGTKSSRVIGLADDIARSMSAVSARVAVIPGRDAIGIELPNQNREIVYLRELLESKEFGEGKGRLQLALGKTIGGDPVIVDLARMPHLLIAGTTGSGKSVAINTMILSLLYRLPPEECRFIMIDPKMLELSVYDGIPHLLTPVVTDPQQAIKALKWTVNEMNARYERMCKLGVRNILGFNQKVARARRTGEPLARTVQTGFDEETGSAIYEREDIDPSPMPYIVVVIDEMADLMMVAGKDIEFAVQRLSQMARAAGIHLIMATQRPSVDVITGTIKANFPSRISFQVTSKIDSRTILGEMGAEQLLGAGDMLTMAAGGRIMRAHGPFVADDEVETVVNFLRVQGEPDYLEGLLDDDYGRDEEGRGGDAGSRSATGDDVYDQAIEVVLRDRRATTSYLQRRLGIGYNRAASLIERMEADGVISAPNRTGKREVLTGEAR